MPENLSVLTPIVFNIKLAHLGSEASNYRLTGPCMTDCDCHAPKQLLREEVEC